ncbi:MAG: thermonuclease family protein [Nanoarchaeota archaeon]
MKEIILILLLTCGCVSIPEAGIVTEVIDGDTFKLSTGERVRLLCINTPENGEPYFKEAKDFLENSISGKIVRLEVDKTNLDDYRRLLRYVYVDDILINEVITKEGLAEVLIIKPNIKHCDKIKLAEKIAQEQKKGIWSVNHAGYPEDTLMFQTAVVTDKSKSHHVALQ